MALPKDTLSRDEQVVLELRTHIKAIAVPIIVLLLSLAVAGIAGVWLPAEWRPWSIYALLGLLLVILLVFVLWPILIWRSATYTITNRRIITRRGVLNKLGHDLPLRSVNNVTYERSITDRMLGCGTLILETAAEEPLKLPDVPGVERVNRTIADLLFDGTPDPEQ